MLRWLTSLTYNRFDAIWIVIASLTWKDREYVAMAVAIIGGAFVSGILETWNRRAEQENGHAG